MKRFEQNKVYRPVTKSSKFVCSFLEYIHQQGFDKAPKYYGSNDDEYILRLRGRKNLQFRLSCCK